MKTLEATVPYSQVAAKLLKDDPTVIILPPPFEIPEFELTMAWSPLLQHNSAHQWIRRLIADVARDMV